MNLSNDFQVSVYVASISSFLITAILCFLLIKYMSNFAKSKNTQKRLNNFNSWLSYSFMNSEQKKYFLYNENSWPIANDLQPKIMQFKTGFRDQKDIKRNIKALEKTLKVFDK